MGDNTETYTQVQNIQNQQVVKSDSIATSSSLRTPIQQIENTVPRHIQVQRQLVAKKPVYKTWTRKDSIYFNLIDADELTSFTKDNSHPQEARTVTINEVVEKNEELVVAEEDSTKNELIEQTIAPAPPVKIRKSSPFQDSKDWLSGFILLALIVAGLVKLTSSKYLNDLFSSIRYQQSATKLYATFNLKNEKPGWALTGLFILSTSLLIFEYTLLIGKSPQQISQLIFFLLVNLGVILYFFSKNIIYRFVAFIFEIQPATQEYLFNANMLSKAFGLVSLPIVCVVPFVDTLTATFLLKAGLILLIVMYIIQLLRGAKIILHTPLSIFYMFLYFCALEILPLSILIKVMIY